jgi:hypothetical protein
MSDREIDRYLQLLVGTEPRERLLDIGYRRAVGMEAIDRNQDSGR